MEYKKLIFIDNDDERRAVVDIEYVKDNLEYMAKLPVKYINTIEIISDFHRKDKDEMMDMLYSGKYCICTWSMYTATHFGSLYQMVSFFSTAAVAQVKDIVYVDASGRLPEDLGRFLKAGDTKKTLEILNAIEQNHIITFKDGECLRMRVELKGLYESPFKLEKVNLKKLLIIEP